MKQSGAAWSLDQNACYFSCLLHTLLGIMWPNGRKCYDNIESALDYQILADCNLNVIDGMIPQKLKIPGDNLNGTLARGIPSPASFFELGAIIYNWVNILFIKEKQLKPPEGVLGRRNCVPPFVLLPILAIIQECGRLLFIRAMCELRFPVCDDFDVFGLA